MKKSSKLFSAILAVLLMVSALGTVPANAAEAEVTVNSLPELQEAIAAAVDGDTIHIAGDIEIQEEVSIGTVDKTVFLAGAEGTSVVLSISPDFPDGQSVSFANLVFCGGQSSGLSFVQSGGTSYFQTVRFQHPNESSGKSACLVEAGNATLSNCHFEEGRAEKGGHIYAGTDAAVHADTKILPEVSYGILPIDQLLEDDFLCPISDVIHGSDPCHLILRFQLLIDTLFLCQLCYKQIEFVSCLSVNVSQIAVQFSAENKVGIKHRAMLFQVLLVLPAPHTNRRRPRFIQH